MRRSIRISIVTVVLFFLYGLIRIIADLPRSQRAPSIAITLLGAGALVAVAWWIRALRSRN